MKKADTSISIVKLDKQGDNFQNEPNLTQKIFLRRESIPSKIIKTELSERNDTEISDCNEMKGVKSSKISIDS